MSELDPSSRDALLLMVGQFFVSHGRGRWHEQIGDPTLADSILNRLINNAHPGSLPTD